MVILKDFHEMMAKRERDYEMGGLTDKCEIEKKCTECDDEAMYDLYMGKASGNTQSTDEVAAGPRSGHKGSQ